MIQEKDIKSNYYIYLLQNKINNKIYVGQTNNLKRRLSQHKQSALSKDCRHLYNAINKYGIENFNFIFIEENLSLEDANYWEDFYIDFFQSKSRLFGYNLGNITQKELKSKYCISERQIKNILSGKFS